MRRPDRLAGLVWLAGRRGLAWLAGQDGRWWATALGGVLVAALTMTLMNLWLG